VAHDRRVGEQPLDVARAEGGDAFGIEALERAGKPSACAESSASSRPDWNLETEALEDAALVAHGPPPLLVVVREVERVGRLQHRVHGEG